MKKVEYFEAGQWPIHIGFTDSEKAFRKELKRICGEKREFLLTDHANATTHFINTSDGRFCAIICLGSCENLELAQIAALIAHEATHVAQRLWQQVGERDVGDETEAYFVQFVTQRCLSEIKGFRELYQQ